MMRPNVPSPLIRAMKLGLNLLSNTLDPRVSFSRADTQSCATYFGNDGLMRVAGQNSLTHSDVSSGWGTSVSGVFGGAGSTGTITSNYAQAPDGTMTAARAQLSLNGATTVADRSAISGPPSPLDNAVRTLSVYLKANSGTPTVLTRVYGAPVYTTLSTTAWTRVQVYGNSTTDSTCNLVEIRGGQTPTNSNTADVLIWGGQLELGTVPGAYMPTTNLPTSVLNYLQYSSDVSQAIWGPQLTAGKSGSSTLLFPAQGDRVANNTLGIPSGAATLAATLSGSGTMTLWGYNATNGNMNPVQVSLTATPTVYVTSITATVSSTSMFLGRSAGTSDTATSVTVGACGYFPGTYTAAQIQAMGGIPLTTTAPASSTAPRMECDPTTLAGISGVELNTLPLSNWGYGAPWVYNSVGMYIDASNTGTGAAWNPSIVLIPGAMYKVTYTVASTTPVNFVTGGNYQSANVSTTGANTTYVTCGASLWNGSYFGLQGGSNPDQISNISIQRIVMQTTGVERVTNGAGNNTSGWTPAGGATVSVNAGIEFLITSLGLSYGQVSQTVNTIVGKTYQISYTARLGTDNSGWILIGVGAIGSNTIATLGVNGTSNQQYTSVFTATATQTYITIQTNNLVSNATLYFSNISVQQVAYNPIGLLVEESRTNLLTYSRDMTQSAWVKTDATIARTSVGLDGVSNTACLVTEGSAGAATVAQIGTAVTAGSTVTQSFYVRQGNTPWVVILLGSSGFSAYAAAWFNLATGALGSVSPSGGASNATSSITSIGGGWYRCIVTCTPSGAYTIPEAHIQSASANGSGTRVSGATYVVDAAQLETGTVATTPIFTTTATVTRAADIDSSTAVIPGAAGTVVIQAVTAGGLPSSVQVLYNLDDGTLNNRLTVYRGSSGQIGVYWVNAGTGIGTLTSVASISNNIAFKIAVAWNTNDFSISLNGASTVTGAFGTPPTVTTRRLGMGQGNSNPWNGEIQRVSEYSTRLPDATLRSLST